MNTPFTFSIRSAIRQSWEILKQHLGFFLGITFITILLNVVGGQHAPWVIKLILSIGSYVWSILWFKVSLAAARNNMGVLNFASIRDLIPTWTEIYFMIGIAILGALITLCGFILLIIPGIYVGIRLSLANLAYLDRKEGVRKSLRYSWNITKDKFWTVLLTGICIVGLYILGVLVVGVGLLVTYPLASILMAKLYTALADDYNHKDTVVVQPAEIPQDLPEVEATA